MAERTELKPMPVKVRPGLIVSGILDIIYSLIAFIVNYAVFALLTVSAGGIVNLEGAVALLLFLLFAVTILVFVFGILTITLCAKKPEVFKRKKKLLIASLVFVSILFLAYFLLICIGMGNNDESFGGSDMTAKLLFCAIPIASVVLKSLALGKKEFVTVTVSDEPAPPVAPVGGNAPEPAPVPSAETYPGLKELRLRRERGLISDAEYEARRAEIVARSGNKEDALKALQAARVAGEISAEEYERRRKLLMEKPERPDIFA